METDALGAKWAALEFGLRRLESFANGFETGSALFRLFVAGLFLRAGDIYKV